MAAFCKHCKQKNPNINEEFCCDGCKNAYHLVKELNLDSFYKYRPSDITNSKVDLEFIPIIKDNFIIDNNDDTSSVNLVAEGIECAACCWLIENAVLKIDGVKSVNISLFNKKINITFNSKLNVQDIIFRIYCLGYKVFPFSESLVQKMQEDKKKDLLKKMAVAAFFAMNIMLFSVSMWFGYDLSEDVEQLFKVMSFILSIPAILYSGSEFFKSAFSALKNKATNMDVAISVAIILSFVYSTYHTFIGSAEIYFESCLMLIFFLLVGRFLEFKTKEKITLLTENIILSDIKQSTILKNGKSEDILSKDLKSGDIILLQKGEKLATDAIILEDASFDVSSVTGESDIVELKAKNEVFAGSILMSNAVKLKATNDFKDNSLSQIVNIINNSKNVKGNLQNLAERISKMYVPVVHVLALLTFLISFYMFDISLQESITRAIAVLIITCPCALALAIPVANTALLSRLYQRGILVKNSSVLEYLDEVKNIAYDKTGTLVDVSLKLPEDLRARELKALKALTVRSKHILSKKIYAQLDEVEDVELKNYKEKAGAGVSGTYYGKDYMLGSAKFTKSKGKSNLVFKSGDVCYELSVEQILNNNVDSCVKHLANKSINQVIISGDKQDKVKLIADKLNLQYFAECKPIDKVKQLKHLKAKSKVLYVGDGINDAASLAVADISVSFAKANEIAQTSADVIMQNNDFANLQSFYSQTLDNKKRIKQNLVISLAYNVLAIPFAVVGFVNPFFAALLMSSSSICVIINTVRK
ncbi:MAG: putative copper-importing P-type ATPase A [Proteobacteria bacterium]|nr:MAG: putative copper-importing P-type ATPase A [Pseudomonadota bacterium]